MKDYKDVARSVFRRRNEYLEEKKRKKELFIKRSAVALSCCLMVLVSFNIWRTDSLKTLAPSPDKSQFNVTEANTTAPPETDENGVTMLPAASVTAVTTTNDQNGSVPAQTVSTTAAVSGSSDHHSVVTSRTAGGNISDAPLPTTYSHMDITVTRHTSAVTTTSRKPTTTARTTTANHRTDPAPSRTTTASRTTSGHPATTHRNTTTTYAHTTSRSADMTVPRTTTTTRHTTTYRTTSAYHTTNYRTTTTYRTTTRIYTTVTGTFLPVPQTTYDVSPVATVTTTTAAHTYYTTTSTTTTTIVTTSTTATTLTGFHYNGNYYKPTGRRLLNEYLDSFGQLIRTEYDEDTGKYFDIYQYQNIDPNFICYAYTEGNYAYFGINEVWKPKTFGELLDGIDAESELKTTDFYDASANERHSIFDTHTVYELLNQYRDKELEITGLSYVARNIMLQNAGESPSELDLSNKLGYISVRYPYFSTVNTQYLNQGYIHITNDGKLEVDLFYLKYTIDIGTEEADELVRKLKNI
ncbi:MAG: hypothetical protein IJJ81_00710 [Ruminococcus sp.]|nr:hypothetical protein [Ruminococcus sp.]